MDNIEHLLKQTDSNSVCNKNEYLWCKDNNDQLQNITNLIQQNCTTQKIAGLILAINYLTKASKNDGNNDNNIKQDLERIYQSMGRKFLFKLLSSPLLIKQEKINKTSLTCYQVAISITNTMINLAPSINNEIIAGIIPLLTNIFIQIISFQKQKQDNNDNDDNNDNKEEIALNKTLNGLNNSIIDCIFMILTIYHNYNDENNNNKLIRYYKVIKSNHYNQKNAEDANVYSMSMSFLKYLSRDKYNHKEDEYLMQQNKKILKIMELMILKCQKPNNKENKSLLIAQKIFIKTLIESYKECQTKLKFEFPTVILSIFYRLFGDNNKNKDDGMEEKKTDDNDGCNDILNECLMELKDICIGSLASRMYLKHRLDIFKLIQMSLIFEKHKYFTNYNKSKKMDSEKLLLFVMSSVSNEIRINLETKPSWNTDKGQTDNDQNESNPIIIYDILDTNLNIFEKLVSFIISDDDEIDAWITTFSSKTLHSIQQDIHNTVRSLFFYITELKHAVFEKNNDDGLQQLKKHKEIELKMDNDSQETKENVNEKLKKMNETFEALTIKDILNDDCLKMLDRILYGITSYINNDLITFKDEFVCILPFILKQFKDKYIVIISSVLSKMLTGNDKQYKNIIIDQLYCNHYVFDIIIGQSLNNLSIQLINGHNKYNEQYQRFEIENRFLSVSLLIYDIFTFNNNEFISTLFDQEEDCKFEMLINIVCDMKEKEIILPLVVMILKIINKTPDKKLNKIVKNGMKKHIEKLIEIASECQKYEHVWIDDIAMNLIQLKQN